MSVIDSEILWVLRSRMEKFRKPIVVAVEAKIGLTPPVPGVWMHLYWWP